MITRISAALLLVQAVVAGLALVPRTDEAYRGFFVTHVASCWLPQDQRAPLQAASLPRTVETGTLDLRTACLVLPRGWYLMPAAWFHKPSGVALRGDQAMIRLPYEAGDRGVDLVFANRGEDATVTAHLDRAPPATVTVPADGTVTLHLVFPRPGPDLAGIDLRLDGSGESSVSAGMHETGIRLVRIARF